MKSSGHDSDVKKTPEDFWAMYPFTSEAYVGQQVPCVGKPETLDAALDMLSRRHIELRNNFNHACKLMQENDELRKEIKSMKHDNCSGGYTFPPESLGRVVLEGDYDAMVKSRNSWRFNTMAALVICTIAVVLLSMSGCAAGKTATGGVVVGFDVAALPETAGEMAGAAAEFLPEPWKSLTLAGVTLLGGGGLLGYAKKSGKEEGWDERESHQAKIDATYDLGRTEASK